MLSLQLKDGEYLTIGEDIVVQVFRGPGPQIQVAVKAPRDMKILRGEVLERSGGRRPDGLVGPMYSGPAAQTHLNRFQTADEPVEIYGAP